MADGDESVVMAGLTGPSLDDTDIVVVKLDAASGTDIWRYQVWLGLR